MPLGVHAWLCWDCLSLKLGLCRGRDDVENPFVLHRPPQAHPLVAQLRSNWWLWSTLAFAVCLIGGLTAFRGSLYNTGAHGLPFLAGVGPPGAQRSLAALSRVQTGCRAFLFLSAYGLNCSFYVADLLEAHYGAGFQPGKSAHLHPARVHCGRASCPQSIPWAL